MLRNVKGLLFAGARSFSKTALNKESVLNVKLGPPPSEYVCAEITILDDQFREKFKKSLRENHIAAVQKGTQLKVWLNEHSLLGMLEEVAKKTEDSKPQIADSKPSVMTK